MKRFFLLGLIAIGLPMVMSSCVKHDERKVVGPTSTTSKIPWNKPIAGQGAGQLGMIEQNRYRR